MSEYLTFFYKHLELSIALVVILLLILWEELGRNRYVRSGVAPQTLVTWMNHEGAVVLDIRAPEAFKKGHIMNALNIPAQTLNANLKKLIKYKHSPVVIVHEQGQSPNSVVIQLKQHGFRKPHILRGGLAAWNQAGLPMVETLNKKSAHG